MGRWGSSMDDPGGHSGGHPGVMQGSSRGSSRCHPGGMGSYKESSGINRSHKEQFFLSYIEVSLGVIPRSLGSSRVITGLRRGDKWSH